MEAFTFYLFSFLIIISALAVVTMRNIFHCALFLILCLFSVAGIFVMLHAEFLAAVQVLIYVGAVSILIIFAIMLTSRLAGRDAPVVNEQFFLGGFMSLVLLFSLVYTLKETIFRVVAEPPAPQSTLRIGQMLMTDYVLPFELVSVLLLAVLIGAIVLARREGN
ncbi:MAG: NADH-quinone oxidoreductase subunit J [candidate division Zixibacteria bacterium]|nr:NADH-quinone oxidoreductase subunit J [candidate division Zixibacteria bacterium]